MSTEKILILSTMLAVHKELKSDAANQKTAQIHAKLMHANKCENNATCVPSKYAGFTCDCKGNKAASWTGRYCQTKGTILNKNDQFTDLRL